MVYRINDIISINYVKLIDNNTNLLIKVLVRDKI